MRVFVSRRCWLYLAVTCISIAPVTGCKSYGTGSGMGWFSWMNPKPSASMASTPPTKPSVAMLPNPGATTAGKTSNTGVPAQQASFPSGAMASHPTTGQSSGSNYYTGPYGMSGQSSNPSSPTGYGATAQNMTGMTGAMGTNTSPSGYQSPYASTGTQVADSRGAYGTQQPAANTANNWNSDQWNRGSSFVPNSGTPAGYTDVASRPADTGHGNPIGSAGGTWTPPATTATTVTNSYLDRTAVTGGATGSNPSTMQSQGFRPGSTNRNGGVLPTTPTNTTVPASTFPVQPNPINTNTGGAYPTTSYPTTSYPSSSTGGSTYAAPQYPTTSSMMR